jgi:AcrR family transcriptional regulator
MTRPPRSRQKVLDAAERIVKSRGAAALTFDEICVESGVTRGGITYHFKTKDLLLKALVERDLAQWRQRECSLKPEGGCNESAELIGYIRSSTDKSEDERRYIAGMVSAALLEPDLMKPVRDFHAERFDRVTWTDADLRRMVLRLAADGLFWLELFRCYELPAEVRTRLIGLMESLAVDWSSPAPG